MGIESCDIFYDNPAATYYEGQTVNGRVEFDFNSTKTFRGIKIEFIGESHTFWQERKERKGPDGKTEHYHVHFSGSEEYFNFNYFLYGNHAGGTYELPAGKHAFPFTCALPQGLPTSFEGENGYVRYTIKVTIDRPWKFDNVYKFAFTMLSVYDLNSNPRLKEEVNDMTSKTFCCCCCESGPFNMNLNMPCSGFVPGQTIPINLDCDNASSTKIKYCDIKLIKVETYHSHTPHKSTHSRIDEIASITTDGLEPGEQATFCEEIEVPPLPPSDLTNCSLIDIDYKLTVKAKVGGCSESPYTIFYLQIGTVPIHEKVDECVHHDEISEPGSDDDGENTAKQPLTTPEPGPITTQPMPGSIGWNQQPGYQPVPVPYEPTPNPYQPTTTPYPTGGDAPFQPNPYQPTTTPYPPTNGGPTNPAVSPYPPATQYPNAQATPYPSTTPYPPATQTQYPNPQTAPYPAAAPYPPATQYPSTQAAPYPPTNAPYPPQQYPQPGQGAPYPAATGPPPTINLPSHIPPPTYTESQYKPNTIHGPNDSEHTNVGTQNYAPRYPVYNFPPTAPPS